MLESESRQCRCHQNEGAETHIVHGVRKDWSSLTAMVGCESTQVRDPCGNVHESQIPACPMRDRIYPMTMYLRPGCFIHNKAKLENTT